MGQWGGEPERAAWQIAHPHSINKREDSKRTREAGLLGRAGGGRQDEGGEHGQEQRQRNVLHGPNSIGD